MPLHLNDAPVRYYSSSITSASVARTSGRSQKLLGVLGAGPDYRQEF
jgi:hypothetical protein